MFPLFTISTQLKNIYGYYIFIVKHLLAVLLKSNNTDIWQRRQQMK
eukprot:UN08504